MQENVVLNVVLQTGDFEVKISEVIKVLKDTMEITGDVELYEVVNDGRSTYAMKWTPKITYKVIWKGHREPPHYYIN